MPEEIRKARARERGEEFFVELCGRAVPAINTEGGLRAVTRGRPVEPEGVERYIARTAMRDLAKTFRVDELRKNAFRLYEKFRPALPEGIAGWGAKGKLEIDRIPSLAHSA